MITSEWSDEQAVKDFIQRQALQDVTPWGKEQILSGRPQLKIFFSSRRRHTNLQGDWSSDVCSSDLYGAVWNRAWQGRNRGYRRKEIRICDHILLLDNAVVALGREHICQAEAVVKHAESPADHALWLRLSGFPAGRPGNANSRSEIPRVVYIGLRLVAQPEAQCEVRPRFPLIAH